MIVCKWPMAPKIFTIWPFPERVCWPLLSAVLEVTNRIQPFSKSKYWRIFSWSPCTHPLPSLLSDVFPRVTYVSLYLEREFQSVSALSPSADLCRRATAPRTGIATLISSCVSGTERRWRHTFRGLGRGERNPHHDPLKTPRSESPKSWSS